uniref:LIM zinc-binding domain-containing protein n=1 Tax=Ditylenchus dipsaci TaxID=166011 RepID=A0A915DP55_9BILA
MSTFLNSAESLEWEIELLRQNQPDSAVLFSCPPPNHQATTKHTPTLNQEVLEPGSTSKDSQLEPVSPESTPADEVAEGQVRTLHHGTVDRVLPRQVTGPKKSTKYSQKQQHRHPHHQRPMPLRDAFVRPYPLACPPHFYWPGYPPFYVPTFWPSQQLHPWNHFNNNCAPLPLHAASHPRRGGVSRQTRKRTVNKALCRECNELEKAAGAGKYICELDSFHLHSDILLQVNCHAIIEEGHIKHNGDSFHPYHFNCKRCDNELTDDAREIGGELYCLRCHDLMGIPICGACHRPVEERVITALGKTGIISCVQYVKPFLGHKHYEKKGLAYCEQHYHLLYGSLCFKCGNSCGGEVFQALGKTWCVKCFSCSLCDKKMDQNQLVNAVMTASHRTQEEDQ